jgi:hypothetical protein
MPKKKNRDLDEALCQLQPETISPQAAWDQAVHWMEDGDYMPSPEEWRPGQDPTKVCCLDGGWWGAVCYRCRKVFGLVLQEESAEALCDEHAKRWHRVTREPWYCRTDPDWREHE